MATAKELVQEVVNEQPEDASYEEIIRELAFERMIARGLRDARDGKLAGNGEIAERIRRWQSGVSRRHGYRPSFSPKG
jgi:hypothetical protein